MLRRRRPGDQRAAWLRETSDRLRELQPRSVEFAETSAELSRLVTIGPPPPSIRGSLLAAIREVRPLPPLTDAEPLTPWSSDHVETPERVTRMTGVDELTVRRQTGARDDHHSRRQRILSDLVAAATVMALALGGWISHLDQQRRAQVAQQAAEQRETELLTAPDAKILTTGQAGARYSFVVSKERNAALFLGTHLANPGTGKELQLWTLKGRQASPDTTFPAAAGSQWFTGPVAGSSVAIRSLASVLVGVTTLARLTRPAATDADPGSTDEASPVSTGLTRRGLLVGAAAVGAVGRCRASPDP